MAKSKGCGHAAGEGFNCGTPSDATPTRLNKTAFESRCQTLTRKHGGRCDQARYASAWKNIMRQFLKEIPQEVKEEAKRRANGSWRGKPNRDSLNAVGEQVCEAWKMIEKKRPLGCRFTTGEHIKARKVADNKEVTVARYRTLPGQVLSKAGMEDQDAAGHSKHKKRSWSNVIPREQRGKTKGMFGIREPRQGESINAAIMPVPSTCLDPHTLVLCSTKHMQQGPLGTGKTTTIGLIVSLVTCSHRQEGIPAKVHNHTRVT